MKKFRVTYRNSETFTKEFEADTTAETIEKFKKQYLDRKEIIDVEPLKQYDVE